MRLTRRIITVGAALLLPLLLAGLVGGLLLAGDEPGADEAPRMVPAAKETAVPAATSPAVEKAAARESASPAPGSQPPLPAAGDRLTLTYEIDRSDLPPLPYEALTLQIYVGPVAALAVEAGPPGGEGQVAYAHDPQTGMVTLTTAAERVRLLLADPQEPAEAGRYHKAALKGNAAWAWSHSLDDNVHLQEAIDALKGYGYRGTLYLIGQAIGDEPESEWRVTEASLQQLLAEGWSIGNHTWDHACQEPEIGRQTIISGYRRLHKIVAGSPVPDYEVIAFAAPCFKSEYQPLIQEMIAAGDTAVQFNESGATDLLIVDPGAENYKAGAEVAASFSYTMPVGRDPALTTDEGLTQTLATVDWMAANHGPQRHFWYNTFNHGDNPQMLAALAGHIYTNYGAGGSGEAWVAPADEIYSYLLVRDRSRVTLTKAGAGSED